MNIYLIERIDHTHYDEFDSMVVVAHDKEEALEMNPSEESFYSDGRQRSWGWGDWRKNKDLLKVTLVGTTDLYKDKEVILSSFHAG